MLSVPHNVNLRDHELLLHWDSDVSASTPEAVRAQFDQTIDQITRLVEFIGVDVRRYNQRVRNELPGLIAQRRQKLLGDRNLEAALGYPIRERDDAATYTVPLRRKRIEPEQRNPPGVTSKSFTPEPRLAQADYEEAINTLLNSRNAIERSPSTAAKLHEEELRDILLINLNGRFEGAAAGEVFNGNGKTDILIRQGDRNIFIGECKFWHGPSKFDEAIVQVLGYTVWRDTKAAIILFIRSGNPTAVIGKAVERLEKHSNYKRRGPCKTEDRHDFVLHAERDPDREIHLALLPFVIGHSAAGDDTAD
jgi:hypothetical protein